MTEYFSFSDDVASYSFDDPGVGIFHSLASKAFMEIIILVIIYGIERKSNFFFTLHYAALDA